MEWNDTSAKTKIIRTGIFLGIIFVLIFPNVSVNSLLTFSTRNSLDAKQPAYISSDVPVGSLGAGIEKSPQITSAGFVENKGQIGTEEYQYYLNFGDLVIYFGPSKISFIATNLLDSKEDTGVTSYTIEFPGGNLVQPVGVDINTHSVNYITADGTWTDVPSFNEILYPAIYPGIDLKYYLTGEGLKYEFLVHAGADPSQIVIALEGISALNISPTEITSDGSFQDRDLIAYQADGTLIDVNFMSTRISPISYAFNLGSYDSQQDLVIDPLVMEFSTYLGGSGNEGRTGSVGNEEGIFVDSLGYIYLCGVTQSSNFPTLNKYSGFRGNWDIFVTKIAPDGNHVIYSTFIGGSGDDRAGGGIEVDNNGNAFVLGATFSSDFPVLNYYQTDPDGSSKMDVIIFKLNATGNGLIYSTYIGGTGEDVGQGLAIDAAGNAYITGYTTSSNYPLKNQYQGYNGACSIILTKLNSTGNGLVFSTYFGGSLVTNYGEDIAVDTAGNVYIVGDITVYSTGSNFPLKNPWDSVAPPNFNEGFIACFNSTGNGLNFSTYVGGSDNDALTDIQLGSDGYIYAVGTTESTDFPVVNAYQRSFGGGSHDAIIIKLKPTGSEAIFSTYFGGNGDDIATDLSLDAANDIVVLGSTSSSNFLTVQPYQSCFKGGTQDLFVTMFNSNGQSVVFSSYLGGNGLDYPVGVWIDARNSTYVYGETESTNYPTCHAYQQNSGGGRDMCLTKLSVRASADGTCQDSGCWDPMLWILIPALIGAVIIGSYVFVRLKRQRPSITNRVQRPLKKEIKMPTSVISPPRFCFNCGSENPLGAEFCPFCGVKLRDGI